MSHPVARLGDHSDHGGVIITSASKTTCEGKLVARVGDQHSCPIPGHGVTLITTGSPNYNTEGQKTARTTSLTGCGASIIGGATKTVCE